MRNVLAMFACIGLAGCILPPVISYTSMALDGISYVATGKSVGDHALSAAVRKDCAVWRAVTEQDVEAVCQEYVEDDPEHGFAVALEAGGDNAAPPAEPPVELDIVELDIAAAPGPLDLVLGVDPAKLPAGPDSAVQPAATHGAPAAANRKAIYLVVGSFRTIDRAERVAAQVPGITAAIAPTLIGDDRYYRVVVGPYEPGETGDAQSRLAAAGIGNTWAASLCTGDLGAPPCDTSP